MAGVRKRKEAGFFSYSADLTPRPLKNVNIGGIRFKERDWKAKLGDRSEMQLGRLRFFCFLLANVIAFFGKAFFCLARRRRPPCLYGHNVRWRRLAAFDALLNFLSQFLKTVSLPPHIHSSLFTLSNTSPTISFIPFPSVSTSKSALAA